MSARTNMTTGLKWKLPILAITAAAAWSSTCATAEAQCALGLDISAWQGNISQSTWNNIHNVENREFVFLRSSRGGTTGYYNQNNSDNNPPTNTLSQRYDDPYFVQNINRATTAGMYAGSYHFGRMDIIASTLNSNGIPNNGTDEAAHFIQMAGPWMRPGYLLPVFDFEAGNGARTASQLAQFAIDFSNKIYSDMGIRPAVYIGNNYANPMNNIPESATVAAAYPTLWNARWPNQEFPDAIPVQTANPGDFTASIYGPWGNPPNPAHPWHFWQYASTGRLTSVNNGNSNLDFDVAKGGVEYLRDHLVPAIWTNDNSGQWTTLANWNSGPTPVAPVPGPGQVAPVGTQTLPTPRLPGAAGSGITSGQHDTVVLDRPNAEITITLASGTHNIRKLYAREALDITGGSLTVNYVPAADSTPLGAQFSALVSLSGSGALSVHTLQVDAQRTFTLGGGSLTLNTINLMAHSTTPATMLINGDVNLSPLANAAAVIANGTGAGVAGQIDLGGGVRNLNVANGSAATDLAVGVPIINGGLSKSGRGTLAPNGANTYTGNTTVRAGTLSVANSFFANASDVYLSTGATLDMAYAGAPDTVNGLYFDGVPQATGTWGAVGTGADHTSPLITGTGLLNVSAFVPPVSGPGNVLDDFEIDEGHFHWAYNQSPVSQTFGLAASTTIDRDMTESEGASDASQRLNLVSDGSASWQIRHNSGTTTSAAPASNVPLESAGYIGFWLKTDDPGITVRIALDDPGTADRGTPKSVIADNEWHLYQWYLEDDAQWNGWVTGDGSILGATVTIDSIFFNGSGNAQIYLDTVSHNPLGLLVAAPIPGDYNSDGVVDEADYNT
jgi:autotransporter-associated beta strand protein